MVRLVNKPCSYPIKDGASRAFETFKDKIMGLYNRVTGSGNQVQRSTGTEHSASGEPEPFNPIEREFGRILQKL